MAISTVRRLAADILGCGERKIRVSSDGLKEAEGAMTRSDVRSLIEKGFIIRLPNKGRASTKRTVRRGPGHRRGPLFDVKDLWMRKVRSQRAFLKMLVGSEVLKKDSKRSIYGKIKSGIFKNKRALLLYLKENSLVAQSYEPPKKERKAEPAPKAKVVKPALVQKAAVASKPQIQNQRPVQPTGSAPHNPAQGSQHAQDTRKNDPRKGERA